LIRDATNSNPTIDHRRAVEVDKISPLDNNAPELEGAAALLTLFAIRLALLL